MSLLRYDLISPSLIAFLLFLSTSVTHWLQPVIFINKAYCFLLKQWLGTQGYKVLFIESRICHVPLSFFRKKKCPLCLLLLYTIYVWFRFLLFLQETAHPLSEMLLFSEMKWTHNHTKWITPKLTHTYRWFSSELRVSGVPSPAVCLTENAFVAKAKTYTLACTHCILCK